jgi:outer membrane protein TolC
MPWHSNGVAMFDMRMCVTNKVKRKCLRLAILLACSVVAQAQDATPMPSAPMPSLNMQTLPYGVTAADSSPLALSLDDAIDRGLQHNLNVLIAKQNELTVHGGFLSAGSALLPNMNAVAKTATQQINLAAMGFKASSLTGSGFSGTFSPIVKVDTTSLELTMSQALFNVPAYYLFRAAQKAEKGAQLTTLNVRGGVVLQVGTYYLKALADAAQIENARSLAKADAEVLRQATASHDAGVGTNLDVLRARVQLQNQQQVLIQTENTFAKDKIALNRVIGLPADQEITLTDTAPYAEYAALPHDDALALAYTRRKDLLGLQTQIDVADQARKAIRAERFPALGFGGYYGVVGETRGLYHGSFVAQGILSVPIFQEAQLRGEREVANAQLTALRQQVASLKVSIDQQIRASMLDVQSANELVKVAESNAALAAEALQDATDRFAAGVEDNLPVMQAQATLAGAQTRLVQTLFQYNQSKLQLARNTGVVETQYKAYLGR